MEVIISKNSEEASDLVARRFKNQIVDEPKSVLGLATGKTPLLLYKKLAHLKTQENLNFSQTLSFNLDEYVGLGFDDKGSYAHYMAANWCEPLGVSIENLNIPNGLAEDVEVECERYEAQIKQLGPIALQILGIGRDGHIGFNEPGSSFGSRTRIKTLTKGTLEDNSSLFGKGDVIPRHVITMGIQTILETSEICLMAFGKEKAQAVKDCIEGPVSSMCPASILQFHPKVKVFLDSEAASLLSHRDYYHEVFQNKPDWQMKEFS